MGTPIDQLRQTIIANDTHKGNIDLRFTKTTHRLISFYSGSRWI
jgi:hypothetical protein